MTDGWNESAQAWLANIDRDISRLVLLDDLMLELVADVESVVDVGCGEGRFCRMLAERGVRVVGLDPTLTFIQHAAQQNQGYYLRAGGEHLPLASNSFDAAVAYLTLIDIPDFRAAIREMARVVKPGGALVVANLSSFNTSGMGWLKDEAGNKQVFTVDNYLEERGEWVEWSGIRVINYHRPLAAYMQAYLQEGLILEFFDQPAPDEAAVRENPAWADYRRAPYFNVMRWQKPD